MVGAHQKDRADMVNPSKGAAYFYSENSQEIQYGSDWNLIGLPVDPPNAHADSLFGGLYTGNLFKFDADSGRYLIKDSLSLGSGCWINFIDSVEVKYVGSQLDSLDIQLKAGWNIISGVSEAVAISDIIDPMSIIVNNTFFGWNGMSYFSPDSLHPGQGYWVQCSADGNIRLP